MLENIRFLNCNGRELFIHEHIPTIAGSTAFIFLNPIFDEKSRAQRFMSETAISLCTEGFPVLRFDYYGSGDSEGWLYEWDMENNIKDIKALIDYFLTKTQVKKIALLGVRLGADMGVISNHQDVSSLFLVEPVVLGKRFLTEQRLRRKAFQKLNNITSINDLIHIHHELYEDHQGYPISKLSIDYLEKLDSNNSNVSGKEFHIFKVNNFSSNKLIENFSLKMKENNTVFVQKADCSDFWATLENVDTSKLSSIIISEVKEITQ